MLRLEQGAMLVHLARRAIESKFSIIKLNVDKKLKQEFSTIRGCFVTIHKNGQLRGCIGYPEPVLPLWQAIVNASNSAAFQDARFPAIEKKELDQITIEISILTKPERIDVRNPEDYLKNIKIGKDGLIVRSTFSSGLLLPQVATEHNWNSLTFLQQTCIKANLHADEWQNFDNCRVYKFRSQIYGESSPNGEIIQVL